MKPTIPITTMAPFRGCLFVLLLGLLWSAVPRAAAQSGVAKSVLISGYYTPASGSETSSMSMTMLGHNWTETFSSPPNIALQPQLLDMSDGSQYLLEVTLANVSSYTITVSPPPGWVSFINGTETNAFNVNEAVGVQEMRGIAIFLQKRWTVKGSYMRPITGEASSLALGDCGSINLFEPGYTGGIPKQLSLEYNLGNSKNGTPLPPLRLLTYSIGGSMALLANSYAGMDAVVSGSGTMPLTEATIRTPQVTTTVKSVPGTNDRSYTVTCAMPTDEAHPFVFYRVDMTNVNGAPDHTIVTKTFADSGGSYETRIDFVNQDQKNFTIMDWHETGQSVGRYVRQTRTDTQTGADLNVDITVAVSATASGTAVKNTFINYVGRLEGGFYTHRFNRKKEAYGTQDYLTTAIDPLVPEANGVILPTGKTAYNQYTAWNQPSRIYRTWLDASPTKESGQAIQANGCETVDYFYADDWAGAKRLPGCIRTKADGKLLAEESIAYAETSSSTNGQIVVVETHYAYQAPGATGSDTTPRAPGDGPALVTINKYYREDAENSFYAKLPYSVQQPDGAKLSYAYEFGAYNDGTFTPGTGADVRVTRIAGLAATTPGATLLSQVGATQIDPLYVVAGRSTQEVQIVQRGFLVRREDRICQTGTTFATASWETMAYNAYGALVSRQTHNGLSYTAGWTRMRKDFEVDETGLRTDYAYDVYGRLGSATRQTVTVSGVTVPAQRTAYEYDADNRLTATRVGAAAGEQLSTTYLYDTGGRLNRTTAPGSVVTTYSYGDGGRTVTQTASPGTTDEAIRILAYYTDGRLNSETGSAVIAQYQTYSFDASNRLQRTVSSGSPTGRGHTETYDLLSRVVEDRTPGFGTTGDIVVRPVYNAKGQLVQRIALNVVGATEQRLSADTLLTYDALGEAQSVGLDLSGADALLTAASEDRFTTANRAYYQDGASAWWEGATTHILPQNNSAGEYLTSAYRRVSGHAANVVAEEYALDAYNNRTSHISSVDPTARTGNELVTMPDGTRRWQIRVGALLVGEQTLGDNPAIGSAPTLTTWYGYDALGRLVSQTDARGLVSRLEYVYGTARVWKTYGRDKDNTGELLLQTSTYDSAGRLASATDAQNRTVSYTYYPTGQIKDESGNTYPVHHVYDSYGQPTELWTYRNGAAGTPDKTFWTYDANTGWLTQKTDPAGHHTTCNYSYDFANGLKIVTQTGARGNIVTAKYRLQTGELVTKSYSDGTPTVTYAYTRTGDLEGVTDAAGTRDFIYDRLQLSGEALDATWYHGLVLTTLYQNTAALDTANNLMPGRYAGLALGYTPAADLDKEMKVEYGYDDFGRIDRLTPTYRAQGSRPALSAPATYQYKPNTSLWETLTRGSFTQRRQFEAGRDVLATVTAQWAGAALVQHTYTTNAAGERESTVQQGSAFADYGDATFFNYTYNPRGELASATGYLGADPAETSQPMPGRGYSYNYDTMGNRTTVGVGSDQVTYSDGAGNAGGNALNQTKRRGTLKTHASGVADPASSIAAAGATAARRGRYWDATLDIYAQYSRLDATMTLSGQSQTLSVWNLLRPATEDFTYDDDGNLTLDSAWSYSYDAENRLIGMSSRLDLIASAPGVTLQFTYDYLGRRVRKIATRNGAVTFDRKFVYDGWNLLAEIDPATNKITRSYVWGLDLAGSLTGSGGVGALVLETAHTDTTLTPYTVAADGNGNIAALVDAAGAVAAAYEYDPFGQLLRAEGPEAANNPFRYSSKYQDRETGLLYYGLRYYDASLGRFVNRDPIEEAGGLNLYAFVANRPVNGWDYLGMLGEDDVIPLPPYEVTTKRYDSTFEDFVQETMRLNGPGTNSDFLDFSEPGQNNAALPTFDSKLPDLNFQLSRSENPYQNGKWINPMLNKWDRERVKYVIEKYLAEYVKRKAAHLSAEELLTHQSTISDMKNAVQQILPGTYSTRTSNNSLSTSTGKVSIASYAPSIDFLQDINSFMAREMGSVHEPVHKEDIDGLPAGSALRTSGLFWAESEVRAYNVNISTIDAALIYIYVTGE